MSSIRRALLAALLAAPFVSGQSLSGLWDATIKSNGLEIPFRFEISGGGSGVRGSFFNGEEKETSASGKFENGALLLRFDSYSTRLEATLKDGALDGTYGREGRRYPFHAVRFTPPTAEANAQAPSIAGLWEVATGSAKGERAWRFIVRQSGAEVSAAILRVDGDTGAIEGRYKDGKFVLSHFDGARPLLLEVTPQADGTLALVENGRNGLTAVRSDNARAQGLPEPADPSRHTSVKDPSEPFHFSAPGLDGKLVSDRDARFRDKVVIVAISGSWCPNCHDEAPFLEELYRKYRSRGLEIVSLSFEQGEQVKDPVQLRAFIREYGIDYTVLVPGEPSELAASIPQAVGLDCWPTTFYLGRDGKVRGVHAGFPGRASGQFHDELRRDVTALIERLLAENAVSER
ncbi:MAG: TlpA disulfide reductase family protein [Bryobacteraceae bacterium]|jgi:thiol-disulfide isomerase/thioredoxin